MKKLAKQLTFLLFTALFMIAVSSVTTAFAADKTMSITLRIEGIKKNLFYATEKVPYTDSLTLQQALKLIDQKEDSITLTGVDAAYITGINGETAAKFGGWDGWLFKVNGKDAAVGIDSLKLSDGDSVLLYYGDPFGVGMQFPVADTSKLEKGTITFTSSDTTYDANNNAKVTVNPVVGATVTWSNEDKDTTYQTDKNGQINIAADQLTAGTHSLQISKAGDNGIPLVLRFAPDYTVKVDASKTTTAVSDNKVTVVKEAVKNEVAKTGENNAAPNAFLVFAIISLILVVILRRKVNYEK